MAEYMISPQGVRMGRSSRIHISILVTDQKIGLCLSLNLHGVPQKSYHLQREVIGIVCR